MASDDKVLLRRYHLEGDLQARDELIERYMSLVRSLARRYSHRGEQLDDLDVSHQWSSAGSTISVSTPPVERGCRKATRESRMP